MAWPEGWSIAPDVVVDGPTTEVPASTKNNVVEWMTVIMPSRFTKDTWVTSVQIRPEFLVDAHFDNSTGNKANPNPNKTVCYGSMTWEEMMNPFYSVLVDPDVDPRTIVRSRYQQVGGGG